MLSGLQPPQHTPEPQTALAASPSRQTGSARLISHPPKPSCNDIPWCQSGGGTEGAGRMLGSCLRAPEFKILQRIPALSPTGH